MAEYRLLPAGDTALIVEFGEVIDRAINDAVLALAGRIRAADIDGVVEIVPTFRSLAIYYEPLRCSLAELTQRVEALAATPATAGHSGRRWRLPVCYDESLAPDLEDVAARTGLTPAQVIEQHSGETYHVYMLGFLPGQAYMGDLPGELALPRRPSPRTKIRAGSVAVAMTMTCIFPLETPCGWHLLGASPVPLWRVKTQDAPLLSPGDKVQFQPISLQEYERWIARLSNTQLVPELAEELWSDAA